MRVWVKSKVLPFDGSEVIGVYNDVVAAKASHRVWVDYDNGCFSTNVDINDFSEYFIVEPFDVMGKSTLKGLKFKGRNRDVRKG